MENIYKYKKEVDEVVEEFLNNHREPLLEMARINMKDDGKSLFPYQSYEITVRGEGSSTKPPHIHIKSKQEGYEIKVYIETGELWQVVNPGRRGKTDKFTDVINKVKQWLNTPSKVPIAKGGTNKEFAMGIWELDNL